MPPYNASDPSATFLSSSCLDFLLIELVPLAYRITTECDSNQAFTDAASVPAVEATSTTNRAVSSSSGAAAGSSSGARKLDEEEELDAVHFRLESLGYRVGQGLVERLGYPRNVRGLLHFANFVVRQLLERPAAI